MSAASRFVKMSLFRIQIAPVIFAAICTGCALASPTPSGDPAGCTEWAEDPRTESLGTVVVGPLPEEKLDAPRLLSLINRRVRESNLAAQCELVFQGPPDVLCSDYLWRDILTPGYLSGMDLLEPIGILGENELRLQLEKRDLRQLLWLVSRAYVMNVRYTDQCIVVGYGFTSHHMISAGALQGSETTRQMPGKEEYPLEF